MINHCFFSGRPKDFHSIYGLVFVEPEVCDWSVVGDKAAAGFDFSYLVPLAVRPVMNDDFATDAVAVADRIMKHESNAITTVVIVPIHADRTIDRYDNQVEVTIVIEVDIRVRAGCQVRSKAEFFSEIIEVFAFSISEEIVRFQPLIGAVRPVYDEEILILVIIEVCEARIPSPSCVL